MWPAPGAWELQIWSCKPTTPIQRRLVPRCTAARPKWHWCIIHRTRHVRNLIPSLVMNVCMLGYGALKHVNAHSPETWRSPYHSPRLASNDSQGLGTGGNNTHIVPVDECPFKVGVNRCRLCFWRHGRSRPVQPRFTRAAVGD